MNAMPQPVTPSEKSYYERHIFFCLNERKNGEECCAHHALLTPPHLGR